MKNIKFEELEKVIREQQAGAEGTAPFAVGEQLLDMCRDDPAATEILLVDLVGNSAQNIREAEKKIKSYADAHKKGNFAFVSTDVADGILREFYGLPSADEKMDGGTENTPENGNFVDLSSYL